MRLIVFSLLLAIAATFPQDVRRSRYIPPRYEDYEDIEATPVSPTLNNALPSSASRPSSSTTQRPTPISPDAGQPDTSETLEIPDPSTVGGSGQSQGVITGQGQGQFQGTDFNQTQGQIPNVVQSQGQNFGQSLEPELNQGSIFSQSPESNLNQGQRPDFGQGQGPNPEFQSMTPNPNPIPSPIPKPQPQPRPRPRPVLLPQPLYPGNKPVHNPEQIHAFPGPCGRFGCWETQPVYPWGSWNQSPGGHPSQAVPYYPQFEYGDHRQTRKYLPPKFW